MRATPWPLATPHQASSPRRVSVLTTSRGGRGASSCRRQSNRELRKDTFWGLRRRGKARCVIPRQAKLRLSVRRRGQNALFRHVAAPGRCGATPRQAAGHYGECLNWANALEQPPASLRGGLRGGPQISVRSLASRKSALCSRRLTEKRILRLRRDEKAQFVFDAPPKLRFCEPIQCLPKLGMNQNRSRPRPSRPLPESAASA